MTAPLAEISNLQLLIGAGVVMLASTVMTNIFMSRLNSDSADEPEGAPGNDRAEALGESAVSSKVGVPRARRIQPTQGTESETSILNPLPADSGMLVPSGLATAGSAAFAKPTEPPKEVKPGASFGTEITSKADIAAALAGFSPASSAAKDTPAPPDGKKESTLSSTVPPPASLVEMKTPADKPAPTVELPPLSVPGLPLTSTPAASNLPPLGSLTAAAKVPEAAKGSSTAVPSPAALGPVSGLVAMDQSSDSATVKTVEKPAAFNSPGTERVGDGLPVTDKRVTADLTAVASSGPGSPVDLTDDVKKQKTPPLSDKPESSATGLILIPPSPVTPAQATSDAAPGKPAESTAPSKSEPEPKSPGRPRIFMPANQPAASAMPSTENAPETVAPVAPVTPAAAEAVPETPAPLASTSLIEAKVPVPTADKPDLLAANTALTPEKPEAIAQKSAPEPSPAKPEPVVPEVKSATPVAPPASDLVKPVVPEPAPVVPTASLMATVKSAFAGAFASSKPEPVAKVDLSPEKSESAEKLDVVSDKIEPAAAKSEISPVKPEPVAKSEVPPAKPEPVTAKLESKKDEGQQPQATMLTATVNSSMGKQDLPLEDGTPGAPLVPAAPPSSVKPDTMPAESSSKPVTPAVAAPVPTPAAPAPAVSVTTSQPNMALTESTTNVPANARAAAQLTLGFEITSLQLTPFFKLGAVQLRPLSNVVSLHLIASQSADNPLAAGISFQIVTVELNEAQHLRSILLKPLPQSQPSAVPQPKLQVDTVQITRAGENAPIQITSSDQTSTAVQLIADFTIAAMDFTPSFEIGSLRLEPTSNLVLLRLAASQKPTALDLPPSFEVANIQLAGDAQFAGVRLTPGTAPKPA